MAKVIREFREHELRTKIDEARAAGTSIAVDPDDMIRLVFAYFEHRNIAEHLRAMDGVPRAHVALEVSRLAGVALALSRMTDAGIVPKAVHDHISEQLREWQDWASRNSRKMVSDADMRDEIGQRVTEAKAQEHSARATSKQLEDAAMALSDWFRWAQEALGLSDAYVEEQKLSVDDLRRMIRGRL